MDSSKKSMKKTFAKGICYDKLLIIFLIGACIGTYYEEILTCIKYLLKTGEPLWESRKGVIYGPFNPLYGFGFALITYVFCKIKDKRNPWEIFLLACLLGGVIEYCASLFMELFVGAASWNYAHKFLNINGRTTIPFMLFWGVGSFLWIYKIYPRLSNWIEKVPYKIGKGIVLFFTVFFIIDMIISFGALFRQDMRKKEIKAMTPVGEFFDKYYSDEVLNKVYPNMVSTRENVK